MTLGALRAKESTLELTQDSRPIDRGTALAPTSYAPMLEKARETVVSVHTAEIVRVARSYGSPQDDLLRRFFGMPSPRRTPRAEPENFRFAVPLAVSARRRPGRRQAARSWNRLSEPLRGRRLPLVSPAAGFRQPPSRLSVLAGLSAGHLLRAHLPLPVCVDGGPHPAAVGQRPVTPNRSARQRFSRKRSIGHLWMDARYRLTPCFRLPYH